MKPPFQRFMESQAHKIDIDKWCEGERLHADPGADYILDWIKLNADFFKIHWNVSKCKDCVKWETCGFELLTDCNKYIKI